MNGVREKDVKEKESRGFCIGQCVKNNEILVVLDESVSSVDRELAGNGGKSENIGGTDVSENGSTDVAEEDWAGLD